MDNAVRGWCNCLVVLLFASTVLPSCAARPDLLRSGEGAKAVEVKLAEGGKALHTVTVSESATEQVIAEARDLAAYLERISGARFEVLKGDGSSGLAVGTCKDFPGLSVASAFSPDPLHKNDYLLRSHARGVYLIGATETAVSAAVWDFLDRLGYRLFFLTDTWEVVPRIADLKVSINSFETPDYITRLAPRGAPWSDAKLWSRWKKRNRVDSAFSLSTGHAYDDIIRRNREAFNAHPEYLALLKGKRGGNKFCISNPGLRKLVVEYAVRVMRDNPGQDSISMEPSDGGGWCECAKCAELGSVSDRVVTLANQVAEAINSLGLGKKYVGFYAYNEQSPPPHIDVHPQVIVSLATAFITGGNTVETMIKGWKAKKATVGIREYHDVFTWSHDLPRRARGGDIAYLRRTIPYFHENGARFMNSENGDSWGANGLGFWLTPRLLWETGKAARVDELIEDFLDKAFGAAKKPMREFYHLLNLDRSVRTDEDVVARMYRYLGEAKSLGKDAAVQERLNDLVLYTRYLELYQTYRAASGDRRQKAFEDIWRHTYRIRGRMMLFTAAICNRERYRDKSVSVPAAAEWSVPEGKNPWKSSAPFTEEEIVSMVKAGIAANRIIEPGFQTVKFGNDLVPANKLGLETAATGSLSLEGRGTRSYFVWLEKPGEIELRVTGGLIAHYRNRGNVKLSLFSPREVTLDPVAHDESVPPDGHERTVVLKSPFAGLHTLQVSDGGDMTALVLPEGLPLTIHSGIENPPPDPGRRWSLYFYVPRRTKIVGGFADSKIGTLMDGNGHTVFAFDTKEKTGYFSVPVPKGQDGKLWKFENCAGLRLLMTVPPCLARNEKELLLPREVVEADARK